MAEPDRVPSTAAGSEAPAAIETSAPVPVPAPGSESHDGGAAHPSSTKLKVPGLATFGAACGYLIGTGFYGEIHSQPGEFILVAVIIGTAAYCFFDPIMELVLEWTGAPHRETPHDRRVITTLAVTVATLFIAALHHSLAEGVRVAGVIGTIALIFQSACIAGATTHYWVRGVGQQPPRAAAWGARTGALVGAVGGVVAVLGLAVQHKIPEPQGNASVYYATVFLSGAGLSSVLWLIPGLLGGLAIEKRWDRGSPSRGILSSFAVLSGLFIVVTLLIARAIPQERGNDAWLFASQLIGLNIGWALGPFLQREACDQHLAGPGCAVAGRPKARKLGGVVVPIDTRRPVEDAAEVLPPVAKPIPPQVLLLQPKGSRAGALVVLVLALIIGAWAYSNGILRTDPEIVAEIETKFEQDSGLHGKTLTAASTDHVVTIRGNLDNGIEHTAAVQRASSVRGVKQLVDELRIFPPAPVTPKVVVAPPPLPSTTIHASVSLFGGSGSGAGARGAQVKIQHRSGPPQPKADTQKRGGLFHLFRKNKKDPPPNGAPR
jgi:hypothetical protein